MNIEIRSREFSFERADVCFLASDWEEVDVKTGFVPPTLLLEGNRVENVPIDRPGQYLMAMGGLSVTRQSDGRQFLVPMFNAPQPINDHDIASGAATVDVEPGGIYRITLFDPREHRALAHRKLLFSAPFFTNSVNAPLETDEAGSLLFLGLPTHYHIEIDPSVGMTIVPL